MSENRRLALGQSGVLGSLYDIRSDNVLPGSVLKSIDPPPGCVRTQKTQGLSYKYTMSDTLEDKLKNLDISAELSASLAGGLIDCSLSANYIMKKKSDVHSRYASVSCTMQTYNEVLHFESIEKKFLSLASLENPNATHVICGVEWGAQTVIEAKTTTTVRSESHNVGRKPPLKPDEQDSSAIESSKKPEKENEKEHEKEKQDEKDHEKDHEKEKEKDKEGEKEKEKEKEKERPKNDMLSVKVKNDGKLGEVLKRIGRIDANANLKYNSNDHLENTEVEFEIITDIADFSSGSLPTDQAGVLEFLKSIPSNLEKVNDGKGVPLKFHLIPIHEVARLFDVQRSADVVLNKLNHHHMEDVIRALDEVMRYLQECTEYEAFVRAHLFCIPRTHLQKAVQDLRAAKSQHWEFQEKFREALKDIRFGEGDVGQLSQVLAEYEGDKPDEVEHSILIQAYRAKSEFADETKNKGSVYLGLGDEKLENIIASGTYEDVYVFYFSEELRQTPRWTEHWSKVFDLLHNKAPQECVIIVDCDMSTTKPAKGFTKLCIEHWRDGNCIIPDVIEDLKELANECQIMCDDRTTADRTRTKNPPSSKRLVRIRCPGINCFGETRKRKWICPRCRTHLYYGFDDDDFYCKCSRYHFSSATFKCNSGVHGRNWTKPDISKLQPRLRSLQVSRECNILLLGATGVGKSTFINAFRNFLEYDSLDQALEDPTPTRFVVPSYFNVEEEMKAKGYYDPSGYTFTVGNESDSEQFSKTGQSSTRYSNIYSFNIDDDLVINLIDTPGIGDTAGREQDKKNIRNILETLESIDKLSGVLFLLKPDQARLTKAFSYYISELVSHLHIDASKNILFGFTRSTNTDWCLGATKAPLDAALDRLGLKGIRNDDTTFLFDSGVFDFIAKTKAYPNRHFNESVLERQREKWNKSSEAVYKLVQRVEDLPVHEVQKTLFLNRTRDLLETLPKPLTEFTTNAKKSQDGVVKFQEKLSLLDIEDKDLAEKLCQLYIPITETEKETFPHPRVVCGHNDCDGVTPCHDKCDLKAPDGVKNVAKIGDCWAFKKWVVAHYGACHRCTHDASEHMLLSYRMVTKTRPLNHLEINKCQDERSVKDDARESLRQEQELAAKVLAQYREEEQQISAAQVLVGTYLEAFTLASHEDVLVKYLDYEIMRARQGSVSGKAKELEQQLTHYTFEMARLKDSITRRKRGLLSQEEVDDAITGLKKMKMFGEFLEKSLEVGTVALPRRSYIPIPFKKAGGLCRKIWRGV
ncbi:unnamed protein product [Alternaria alternata]